MNQHATPPSRSQAGTPPLRVRLAPSPTGHMHLGNAWTFLLCWLAARQSGGTVLLRMEDSDTGRCRKHFTDAILQDLTWLGLSWDEGPYFQTPRMERYAAVVQDLLAAGHAYPCTCSRKELQEMASAPHGELPPYPGTCRHLTPVERLARQGGRPFAIRLVLPEHVCSFHDLVHGTVRFTPLQCGGDFPIRRADGIFAYQLTVAVDDLDQGITLVVRGADLLSSTPRQQAIFDYLGALPPGFAHVPLLHESQGERLAKRHGALSLHTLRAAGTDPKSVCGVLAWLARLIPRPEPCLPQELVALFSWDKIPRRFIRLPDNMAEILHNPAAAPRGQLSPCREEAALLGGLRHAQLPHPS